MKPYLDILQEFEERNKHVSGSLTISDKPLAGKYEYYVPDFFKMSIGQAIKVSESETVEFEKSIESFERIVESLNKVTGLFGSNCKEFDRMIDFCNAEYYQAYTGEYWFETTIFQPYKKIFVSYSKRTISDKDGYNFKTLKELIDYVDSWF